MHKNSKGFTLIEIVVSIAIIALLAGLVIGSLTVIPQTRMKGYAQTLKTEFELTRNFAKTHGGESVIEIEKVKDGIKVTRIMTRTGTNLADQSNVQSEEQLLDDFNLELYYYVTGDSYQYQLGKDDHDLIKANKKIRMEFSQTDGSIIGPDLLDSITITNGAKSYTFLIRQVTGMIYYDYEIEEGQYEGNVVNVNNSATLVAAPTFIVNGKIEMTATIPWTGESVQPEMLYDSTKIKIAGEYRAKDKNTREKEFYTIIFVLKDPYSTTWADGSVDPKTLQWKIE